MKEEKKGLTGFSKSGAFVAIGLVAIALVSLADFPVVLFETKFKPAYLMTPSRITSRICQWYLIRYTGLAGHLHRFLFGTLCHS